MAPNNFDMDEAERLFRQGHFSRRQFVQALGVIGVSLAGIEALVGCGDPAPAAGQTMPSTYFALIVLDAFRPGYRTLAPMPALESLMREGVSYDRAWVGQLESETPVGHATLSTGSMPKRDGIIGFEWRDPTTGKELLDGWEQGSLLGQVGRDMHAAQDLSIPMAIKQADPSAVVVTLSSEKVYAADAMSARAADYVFYHRYSGTQLLPSSLPGQTPPATFFQHAGLTLDLPLKHFTDWDQLSTRLALAAMHEFQPRALMVNLPGADFYGHKFGGPATPAVMRKVVTGLDRSIGKIVQAYKAAGIYDQTLFVITSDHGMVPNDRAVLAPEVEAAMRRAGTDYLFHTGGSAKYIYLKGRRRAPEAAREMATLNDVTSGYFRTLSGAEYERGDKERLSPELDAAYRYLLSTFTGSTAPDIVAPYRENTIGTHIPTAYGNHGGLTWGAQHVPLVLRGPGVRRGVRSQAPARLVDVAPTVLRLLGLSLPQRDGIVLADAVQSATPQEVHRQVHLNHPLTVHQNALIQQSMDNVEEDRKTGTLPPPPLPLDP